MNPQVIAVDEITAAEDIAAMAHAANCGAALLATMHASGLDELRQKPLWPLLRDSGVFSRTVIDGGTYYISKDLEKDKTIDGTVTKDGRTVQVRQVGCVLRSDL